jgi:hypothetical protein
MFNSTVSSSLHHCPNNISCFLGFPPGAWLRLADDVSELYISSMFKTSLYLRPPHVCHFPSGALPLPQSTHWSRRSPNPNHLITIQPEYPVVHHHYNWPVKMKPRKSSETSSSANLSHTPWGYPKTKAYNVQFGLQIPCKPVTKRHVKHGNAVWLMWRRSGRWWLEHDLPATIEVYPSSFFLF